MNVIEGNLDGTGLRIGIVAGRFNDLITSRLLEGARDGLVRHGVDEDDITVVMVPGAFEIPVAARRRAQSGAFDSGITLGAVTRHPVREVEILELEPAIVEASHFFDAHRILFRGIIVIRDGQLIG